MCEVIAAIPPWRISDHNIITIAIKHPKPRPTTMKIKTRCIRRLDKSGSKNTIASTIVLTDDSVTSLTNHYSQLLLHALDLLAPEKERTITIRPSHPWFDDDFRRAKQVQTAA